MTPPDYKETAQAIWQEALRFRSFVVGGYDVPDHMDSPPKAIATALTQADALGYARGLNDAVSQELAAPRPPSPKLELPQEVKSMCDWADGLRSSFVNTRIKTMAAFIRRIAGEGV